MKKTISMSLQPRRGTIVIDLDGTICEHRFPGFGQPVAGAQKALQRLKAAGAGRKAKRQDACVIGLNNTEVKMFQRRKGN